MKKTTIGMVQEVINLLVSIDMSIEGLLIDQQKANEDACKLFGHMPTLMISADMVVEVHCARCGELLK